MRILIAEDDFPLASFLQKGLEAEHYAVDVAPDGEEAHWLVCACEYDLMVLDLNLPKLDGFGVLGKVRPRRPSLPVLVLTGRSRLEDRVHALDAGADDCLLKPFSFTELAARVRALLRRRPVVATTLLKIADLELDRVERTVRRAGKQIELTSKEFGLLEYLLRNAGHRITRNMIVEHVWNLSFDTGTNIVDVYINYLRKKVDDGFTPKLIHTVRGVGYELRAPAEAVA
ncbi:MAG TPA: response regulator transcription factor [Candidatus Angelobacter sp.]|jgi:two-component system copper resistance phosphate regulon response regulator CusR|nr:response regulator transcription factor [Candidatus Angelobacter sp.]